MSSFYIVPFVNHVAGRPIEFRNSFGGDPFVWFVMARKYLNGQWWQHLDDLWNLENNPTIPIHHRAVLVSTFDNAIVSRHNFPRYVQHVREFLADFPPNSFDYRMCHWWGVADMIESFEKNYPRYTAIGFHGTSVNPNPWNPHDEQLDRHIPYDTRIGKIHFEVYGRLEMILSKERARRSSFPQESAD